LAADKHAWVSLIDAYGVNVYSMRAIYADEKA